MGFCLVAVHGLQLPPWQLSSGAGIGLRPLHLEGLNTGSTEEVEADFIQDHHDRCRGRRFGVGRGWAQTEIQQEKTGNL